MTPVITVMFITCISSCFLQFYLKLGKYFYYMGADSAKLQDTLPVSGTESDPLAVPGSVLELTQLVWRFQVKFLQIFTESAPLGRFSHRVVMSVVLGFCAIKCSCFLGLSLALRSHDQFQDSHWSSPLPPPKHPPKMD